MHPLFDQNVSFIFWQISHWIFWNLSMFYSEGMGRFFSQVYISLFCFDFSEKNWLNFNRIIKIITTFSRTKLKSFPDVTQIVWEKSWIQFQILFWKWGYQSRIIVFLPKNFGNVWIKLKWVEDVWNVLGFSKKELSEL